MIIRRSNGLAIRAIAAATAALHLTTVFAQTNVNKSEQNLKPRKVVRTEGSCPVLSEPIYDASGYWYQAELKVCGGSFTDITKGPNAIHSGQILSPSVGRFWQEKKGLQGRPPGVFIRAEPNKSYPIFQPKYDMGFVPLTYNRTGMSWGKLGRAFPFIPTKFYELKKQDGYTYYGYTDLKFLPSKRQEAYPLNEKSIIIAANGIGFVNTPTSLMAQLYEKSPTDEPGWVELIYLQQDEKPYKAHRAFVRQYNTSTLGKEWSVLAADPGARSIADSESNNSSEKAAAFLGTLALTWATLAVGSVILGNTRNVSPSSNGDCNEACQADQNIRRSEKDFAREQAEADARMRAAGEAQRQALENRDAIGR